MGFYYLSVFSLMLLGVVYVALALVLWGTARVTRGMAGRKALLAVIGMVFLILPIGEELWIAWNFGQACKEAGTFIYKKVEVDGFYDDTRSTHAGTPTPQAVESFEKSGYRFFEMKGREKFVRIEKIDDQWRAAALDYPTARYHYQSRDHLSLALKVVRHESIVIDAREKQTIGKETIIGRYAPWFFVGLDTPQMQCYGSREVRGLIYESVLIPSR